MPGDRHRDRWKDGAWDDPSEDPFGLYLLAAYVPGEGIVLMRMEVEKDKENEIIVAPKLLQCLDLRGKVVTGDAMHTQHPGIHPGY